MEMKERVLKFYSYNFKLNDFRPWDKYLCKKDTIDN